MVGHSTVEQTEIDAATRDAELYGSGYLVDGKRVSPERIFIYERKSTK
jgi:hypothetical protein